MPLVNAKCTNCGGTLQVDNKQEAAVCQYCGSAFIVEKAIQNYNYYVTQNIKAENVNVTAKGEAEKERLLHNAETNMGFKDYNKAYEIYKQVSEDYPDDYRGWYGMAKIITENFSQLDITDNSFQQVSSYIKKSVTFTNNKTKEDITNQWNSYNNRVKGYRNDLFALRQSKLNQQNSIVFQINEINKVEAYYTEKLNRLKNNTFLTIITIILFVISFIILKILLMPNDNNTGIANGAARILGYIILLLTSAVVVVIIWSILNAISKSKKRKKELEFKNRIVQCQEEKVKLSQSLIISSWEIEQIKSKYL